MNPHPHIEASWRALETTDDGPIERTLRELSPLHGDTRRFSFHFMGASFERSKYSEHECVRRGLTLASPQKLTIQLVVWNTTGAEYSVENVIEQELHNGEYPIRTELGTVVHDGSHRAIRGELAPAHGLFPNEGGWRVGFAWGDHIDFEYARDGGLELTARCADDGVPSAFAHEPAFAEAPPRKKVTIVEPKLPVRARVATEAEAVAFFETVQMPDSTIAHESVPTKVFDNETRLQWTFEDFRRVIEWLQSDEAKKIARASPSPVRVIGPGLVLARWIRRAMFLTAQHAIARANALTFGPREKPRKTEDLSWMPHDTWNPSSAMTLVRARLSSDAHTPPVRLSFPIETADVMRSVRVPSYMNVAKGWSKVRVARESVAELPVVAIDERGYIARPDVFSAPVLSVALAFGSTISTREPLTLEAPETSLIESSLTASLAQLGGATRVASFSETERSVVAVDATDGAYAVMDSRGLISWVEPAPLSVDGDSVREESVVLEPGPLAAGAVISTTNAWRDRTLAVGRLVRIGFDLRVPEGALWLSGASLGSIGFSATKARVVESVLRDTPAGMQAWDSAASSDTLASVGQRIANGDELVVVIDPVQRADDPRSPEQKLLDVIEGRPASVRRQPLLRTGPDALVVDRRIYSRRGREDIASVIVERERTAAMIERRRALADVLDEPARTDLRESLRDVEWQLERGADLPPGVIAVARWTLCWTEPAAKGSTLATFSGHTFSIDQVSDDRFFEGASTVDALINPASREAIRAEALAFGAVSARGERLSLEPGATFDSILRARSIDPSSDGPLALYLVRVR